MSQRAIGVFSTLLAIAFMVSCGTDDPPRESRVIIREHSPVDRAWLEVVVQDNNMTVGITRAAANVVSNTMPLSIQQGERIRHLFARALQNQPRPIGEIPPLDAISFEISIKTPARRWVVDIHGSLTQDEYAALDYLNTLLPPSQKFDVDAGFRRRSR